MFIPNRSGQAVMFQGKGVMIGSQAMVGWWGWCFTASWLTCDLSARYTRLLICPLYIFFPEIYPPLQMVKGDLDIMYIYIYIIAFQGLALNLQP